MCKLSHSDIAPYQIQTFSLQGLPEILRGSGIDPVEFLGNYTLSITDLEQKNTDISYWTYATILQDASEVCETPHLGLLLSHTLNHLISSKSVLVMLLKQCHTVGEAIESIIKYYSVVSEGASYELRVTEEHAWFIRRGHIPELSGNRILQELSLCDFLNAFKNIIGADWQPEMLFFSYPAPDNREVYDELLHCPISFEADQQALQFDSKVLEQKVQTSESLLNQLLRDLVSRSLPDSDTRFRDTVSQVVDILLPTGVCGTKSIATLFDMNPRTLRRRLQDEGISFAGLLEDRRKELARFYLRETSMMLSEVSLALGYRSPEAFTRAFRRWYSLLPSEWRSQHSRSLNKK